MRKVFDHPAYEQVGLCQSVLSAHGIETTIKNEIVSGLAGEIPFGSVYPELWILDDARFDEAISLLLAFRRKSDEVAPATDWPCPNCGESVPGTFDSCWKCETLKPSSLEASADPGRLSESPSQGAPGSIHQCGTQGVAPMRPPTRSEFRWLALIGLSLGYAPGLFELLNFAPPSQEIADVLSWNNYGSPLPEHVLRAYSRISFSVFVVGNIGFLCFRAWSRWLIAGGMLAQFILGPFLGLYVGRALPGTVEQIGGVLFLIPLVLSFFSPCCEYFGAGRAARRTGQADSPDPSGR